jgi:predicted DNA binding CopG/RHH family protein
MKRKSKSKDADRDIESDQESRWEAAARRFEDPRESLRLMRESRLLTAAERRDLFGPGKTKAISLRMPEEDLEALKEIAEAYGRPYQQLVIIAVQQYLDRVADRMVTRPKKKSSA